MKIKLLLSTHGEVDLLPHDFFTMSPCCMPVSKWLTWCLPEPDIMNARESRMRLFLKAARLVFKEKESDDVLRHEPYVVFSYNALEENPDHNTIQAFLFKYDNNGNTFKVICEKDEDED